MINTSTHKMASFPKCNTCKQAFKWQGPDPFLLPCLHAVCKTCLTPAETGYLRCTECKRDFDLQKITLKTDRVRQRYIRNLTAKHCPEELLCTHDDDGNQAVCWCQECEEFLCEHCQNMHSSFKILSSHTVMSICDIESSRNREEFYCSQHKKYVLELCDENCGIPICLKCRKTDHAWHVIEQINAVHETSRNLLQDQVTILTDEGEKVQSNIQELTNHTVQLDRIASLQRDNIDNTFDTLRSLIDQRHKEITMLFDTQLEKAKSTISDQVSALSLHRSICSNIVDYAEIVLGHAVKIDLISISKVINDKANKCISSDLHNKGKHRPIVTFEADSLCELKRSISTFSEVVDKSRTSGAGGDCFSCAPTFCALAALTKVSDISTTKDLSGVQFLYKEEATEEQKARARKYLLPENFYLYETKPPCPGCIGCEDYDPSNPITPSKQKTKAKSETSSPVVSGAHASSIDTSGASGEFSLFKQSTGPSFSTLAAQGDASGYAFKKDESRPFHWSGAGRPLSGSSPGGQKDEGDGDDFKPVIDLPDLVEVKTGEEDWEVVYSQRSKLYRYVKDVNQWKERAVGEMKILKQNDKYRLLMRRDQVHKVACNHLLSPSLKLEPMATSETAWCWIAQDYAENEPKIEHFALRFKTEELAKQFKQKFEECQEHLRQTVPKQEESVTEEAEEEEIEGEDSDEEIITLFEKRATLSHFEDNEWKKLGLGNLKILYNEDLNGYNIEMVADDGKKICNHVICREHTIMLEKKHRACMWSPIDFSTDEPVRRHFKASFSSVAAAEEFVKIFTEGVRLARDSELSEMLSHEMDTPVVFSRGDAPSLQENVKTN